MKKLYIILAILFLGVMACEKEDFGGETTEAIIDKNDNFKIVELNGYIPTVITKSAVSQQLTTYKQVKTSTYLHNLHLIKTV